MKARGSSLPVAFLFPSPLTTALLTGNHFHAEQHSTSVSTMPHTSGHVQLLFYIHELLYIRKFHSHTDQDSMFVLIFFSSAAVGIVLQLMPNAIVFLRRLKTVFIAAISEREITSSAAATTRMPSTTLSITAPSSSITAAGISCRFSLFLCFSLVIISAYFCVFRFHRFDHVIVGSTAAEILTAEITEESTIATYISTGALVAVW